MATAIEQQRLAESPHFLQRVTQSLANVAFQVIGEGRDTPTEVIRYNYARLVTQQTTAIAAQTVTWLVQRPNLLSETTSYNFDIPAVVTSATDAEIESQLSSDWNIMAGV